jgi:ketosteroid isomerase-like protein
VRFTYSANRSGDTSGVAEKPREVVGNAIDALAEGGVEGMLAFIHEDFEMFTPPEFAAEPDTYRGPAGVRRWFDSFYEAMDSVGLEVFDLTDVGGDQVVGTIRIIARGGTTGIETTQEAPVLARVADGKLLGMSFHTTPEDAFAAAQSGSGRE